MYRIFKGLRLGFTTGLFLCISFYLIICFVKFDFVIMNEDGWTAVRVVMAGSIFAGIVLQIPIEDDQDDD